MTYKRDTTNRPGKTAKDRASGAQQRNYENKKARADYQNDINKRTRVFPKTTCNGKKNRHRGMGKGDNYRIHA